MNEPHGPLYYDGQYHLFYQHNPNGPYWANIHWGHWVSDDLVHWRHLPPALAPDPEGIAPHGIWSGGSTVGPDGDPVLLFTAGDMDATPDQSVAAARPATDDDRDLVEWHPAAESLLERPPGMGLRENDYRDPFVWREGERWFCLVGTGFADGGGAALLYESRDLEAWTFRGALHRCDSSVFPELGDVWELPVLLPLGTTDDGVEKRVFLISPVGGTADVEVYYWIGEFDPETARFEPDHDEPRLIDYGDFHFTGPHGMVDPSAGRSLLFSITQDNRRPADHYDAGWAHSGGLPVELFLWDDGTLGVSPVEELERLRERRLASVRDEPLAAANEALAAVDSATLEVRLRYAPGAADRYGLTVRRSPDDREHTLIRYDEQSERITVNCERSTLDPDLAAARSDRSALVHEGPVPLDGEPAEFRVFVDRSVVETYVNRRKSVTTTVYPEQRDATGLELWGRDDLVVDRLDVWELADVNH
jgi:sucrose-6-phosphate hydrolase SacC (GH32 family)